MAKITIFILVFLLQCKQRKVQVQEVALGSNIDNEIVLINIGDGDRSEIANLLIKIEKCKPLVIGIDAIFLKKSEPSKDSMLGNAFSIMSNEVLAYRFDSTWKIERSIEEFRNKVSGEGFINIADENGVLNHFIPVKEEEGIVYESFALKIIKLWKPSFKLSILPNTSVPIRFKRSLEDFHYFEKPNLEESAVREFLSKKIVLVGYLGPSSEDKHFTPLRSKLKIQGTEPDTFGVVIIANAIRTLLEYYKE